MRTFGAHLSSYQSMKKAIIVPGKDKNLVQSGECGILGPILQKSMSILFVLQVRLILGTIEVKFDSIIWITDSFQQFKAKAPISGLNLPDKVTCITILLKLSLVALAPFGRLYLFEYKLVEITYWLGIIQAST